MKLTGSSTLIEHSYYSQEASFNTTQLPELDCGLVPWLLAEPPHRPFQLWGTTVAIAQ